MKKEKYIVEIEMPDGDAASSIYIQDITQSDCDIEDEGRWKVSVKEYWKPSDKQLEALRRMKAAIAGEGEIYEPLNSLYEDLKKLKGKL